MRKTKRSILGFLVGLAVLSQTIIIAPGQVESTQTNLISTDDAEFQQLQSAFAAELTEYSKTHTDQQMIEHAIAMAEGMTWEAVDFEPIVFDPWPGPIGGNGGDFPEESGSYDSVWQRQQQCRATRIENCRRQYNAELFSSAAAAVAIMAGCLALSGGTLTLLCAAAALTAHLLQIAAAKQRYHGCVQTAMYDCRWL